MSSGDTQRKTICPNCSAEFVTPWKVCPICSAEIPPQNRSKTAASSGGSGESPADSGYSGGSSGGSGEGLGLSSLTGGSDRAYPSYGSPRAPYDDEEEAAEESGAAPPSSGSQGSSLGPVDLPSSFGEPNRPGIEPSPRERTSPFGGDDLLPSGSETFSAADAFKGLDSLGESDDYGGPKTFEDFPESVPADPEPDPEPAPAEEPPAPATDFDAAERHFGQQAETTSPAEPELPQRASSLPPPVGEARPPERKISPRRKRGLKKNQQDTESNHSPGTGAVTAIVVGLLLGVLALGAFGAFVLSKLDINLFALSSGNVQVVEETDPAEETPNPGRNEPQPLVGPEEPEEDEKNDPKLQQALATLRSPEIEDMSAVVQDFRDLGDPGAKGLCRILRIAPSTELKARSIFVLKQLGEDAKVVSADLLAILSNEKDPLGDFVTEALGNFGPSVAEPINEILLNSNSRIVQRRCLKVVQQLGPDAAAVANTLVIMVKKQHPLSGEALYAIEQVGPATIPGLTEVFPDLPAPIQLQLCASMGKMGAEAKGAVPLLVSLVRKKQDRLSQAAARALTNIGESAVPEIINSLSEENTKAHQLLANACANIGAPAVEPLAEALEHERSHVRYVAAYALSLMDPEQAQAAIPALQKAAQHEDPNLRSYAATALQKLKQ